MVLRDRRSRRVPTYAVAVAILGLIGLLATLQYRWLGQISDAERDRLKSTLAAHAGEFAQDVDRELTRAYLLFQIDASSNSADLAVSLGERYDRWNATARFPKLIKDVYFARSGDAASIERFDPAKRALIAVPWPDSLRDLRRGISSNIDDTPPVKGRTVFVHTITAPIAESVPAVVIPTPLFAFSGSANVPPKLPEHAPLSAVYLLLDRGYITHELLPALTQQHFRSGGFDYQVAVLRGSGELVYSSDAAFAPSRDDRGDASAELLQVRAQDFTSVASEVRRYTAFAATTADSRTVRDTMTTAAATAAMSSRLGPNVSIVVQQGVTGGTGPSGSPPILRATMVKAAGWKLVVEHPSGSLERAVGQARRRNLAISMSVLGVLGASLGFLVVTTRRAQDLARRQIDFVATVSHELRTPLAVIRSAADNLADGVIDDGARIREYGELMRTEGRRLSDLVEQILVFAGLQSGPRAIATAPIVIGELLRDVIAACEPAAAAAGVRIEPNVAGGLPAVRGDADALRRVFQNLVGNAIKYGADGKWVGVDARAAGDGVEVSVSDRGIGIPPSEQAKIFEPFYRAPEVVHAQIQGAGLGLSLVSRIVAAHGGRISVKSAPGAGSTFAVVLPAARDAS
jgi:signal transduction histidine kinase